MDNEIKDIRKYGNNTVRNQSGRFVTGNRVSPKVPRHRATKAAEALLEGQAEALTQKTIDMALAGDLTALKLCLERVIPPRRDRSVELSLTNEQRLDLTVTMATVIESILSGDITPVEGEKICRLIEN